MKHELVYPNEFIEKLEEAYQNSEMREKFQSIGANNVQDLIKIITKTLNLKFPKLHICGTRNKSKEDIKEKIENDGNTSKFAGYFLNENGLIDAYFFYIEPGIDSANDILTRQVMPTLIGVYKNIKNETKDIHFNCKPVYILSLCTTKRMQQNSVKKTIICAELLGFNYIDIFDNNYYDIINNTNEEEIPLAKINTLFEFDSFLKKDGINEYFSIDFTNKSLKILNGRLCSSANPSAELYRYAFRIIPAIYMAKEEKYVIDATELNNISFDNVVLIKDYISKIGE